MEDKRGPKSEIEIINDSYDMSVQFWFIGPLISDMSIVRVGQFMTYVFQHGYSEWRNLEYGKEYETAKPQFGIAVL